MKWLLQNYEFEDLVMDIYIDLDLERIDQGNETVLSEINRCKLSDK